MATYNDQGPNGQVQRLQDEITREVNADAQHIATSVFGKKGNMPDMARMSDEQLDARYRTAYMNQDRQWLTQEAQRDPEQFVTIARRIGVQLPEEIPPVPQPPPVAAPPLPPGPPPAPAVAPLAPGMTLGAVAQPAQPVPLTAPPVTV